jgi:hypothetical protein
MRTTAFRLSGACIAASLAFIIWAQQQPSQRTTRFGVAVQPGPMDSILLKDYAPASSLKVPQTHVAKARFPVIDVHTHTGQSRIRTAQDVADWVRTMDEAGIETTVVFTGVTGEAFDKQVELFKPYGNRFQLWCALEGGDVTAPEPSGRSVRRKNSSGAIARALAVSAR